MFGFVGVMFALCLSGFGFGQQGSRRAIGDTAIVIQVAASHSVVKLPRAGLQPENCEPTERKVKLYANATNPNKTEMKFTWQVPVGRLIGKNREVIWDLTGVEAGTYTATVEASDKLNHTGSGSVEIKVDVCPGWLPDPPPCPFVSVSCPVTTERKEPVTFDATVAGADSNVTYRWSLSAGKIISGKGTSKIVVDVSSIRAGSVTGTVKLGGVNPACFTVASCKIEVNPAVKSPVR